MVQSLIVYNLENKVIAWYTSPKLKFFKLDVVGNLNKFLEQNMKLRT